MSDNYKFFTHEKCEYFPCHKGIDKDKFNCLFCYCPLYMLGDKCGGNYTILDSGIKSCMNCAFPHNLNNYDMIIEKFSQIAETMKMDTANMEIVK